MKISREKLLTTLKVASVGASLPPRMVVLEQSDCFIFHEDSLVTFNDEIMARMPNPLDFDMVVSAGDFMRVLEKMPDKEVEVYLKKGQVVVKGKRRSAGITVQSEIKLPFQDVPTPGKWFRVREGATGMLKQAGRTCGRDLSNPLTTVVHVTPKRIEATDNFRLFRATLRTGFREEVLIPSNAVAALETVPLIRVSVHKGWVHFKTAAKGVLSVRCQKDDYVNLTNALKINEAEHVKLPGNLADIVERSNVMNEGNDPVVKVAIENKLLTISTRKEVGWYKETKKIAYKGPALTFHVHPKFLSEVLQRTTEVSIGEGKMKLEADGIEFVVALEEGQ